MEEAVYKIREYMSGNRSARIQCDEDGEIYRLFYEVNTLVSALNAHAENEKSEKIFMKDTISNISHQLKTPIAALNIYNGLIQDEAGNDSDIMGFAKLSEQELDRMESLVQDLLKITRLDAGTIIFEKKNENVSDMMENIRERFRFRAERENKAFSGDEKISLYCDRNWIEEAVGNIVKNALDHTKEGDGVWVEWRSSAFVIQIIVKDSGSGIHPEDIYHIFKRFYRSRFSKDKQGAGLGLPLAKAIVEAHNGTIEAESTPGTGASFTINFLIPTKM